VRAQPKAAATALPKPARSLDVDQITVVAPGGRTPIVKDVRFGLKAGEALGIIGPSGAGKTSLVRALVGVWPAARGSVRLDGATLDQWEPEALGRHIGFVSQTVELFDGTISENIARMSPEPDSEAVLRAAQLAGAHDLILRMPAGYDTPIGEGGMVLSGGQRQRIALARALAAHPPVLVLHDPTTAVDAATEHRIAMGVSRLRAGHTTVVLASSPALLARCDRVLLVDGGAVVASGSHAELVADERYRQAVLA
jgi:ABC-type protease/lipase transport system fused ATPase/permease subunit